MGMFDSFYDSDGIEWQTKALDNRLDRYQVGDRIPGPATNYQIEVCGGPGDSPYQRAFATVRNGALASLPDKRDNDLPIVDYGGSWKEVH